MTTCELARLRPIKVRLNTDLTKYHPDLNKGVEGTTRFDPATWGVWCDFPGAGRWDIIPSSLDILDEEYLAAQAAGRREERERLQTSPVFFTSYRKTHLVVDIIHNDHDWDTKVMACGHTAKTGSSSSHLWGDEKWCPDCKAEYDHRVKAGLMPDRST